MAISRTVLPRKGLVQPQHGITQYETDMDVNLAMLDANVAYISDLSSVVDTLVGDLGLSGVVGGFQLSTSNTLYPGLTNGILYANGSRYAPSDASAGLAPANATSYLFLVFFSPLTSKKDGVARWLESASQMTRPAALLFPSRMILSSFGK